MRDAWDRAKVAGFSLVELMIVVALLASLAAIAAPSVGLYLRRAEARDTARGVANAIRYARDQAMSRGEVVVVDVNPSASNGNGVVEVQRLLPADQAPRSCREASWKLGAGTLTLDTVYTFDVSEEQPDMEIAGQDATGTSTAEVRLCAMPDGRVGQMSGLPFTSQNANCINQELRLWVAEKDYDLSSPAFGSFGLVDCVEDGLVGTTERKGRQEQRDSRDLANLWMITVSYNGSVDASQ